MQRGLVGPPDLHIRGTSREGWLHDRAPGNGRPTFLLTPAGASVRDRYLRAGATDLPVCLSYPVLSDYLYSSSLPMAMMTLFALNAPEEVALFR